MTSIVIIKDVYEHISFVMASSHKGAAGYGNQKKAARFAVDNLGCGWIEKFGLTPEEKTIRKKIRDAIMKSAPVGYSNKDMLWKRFQEYAAEECQKSYRLNNVKDLISFMDRFLVVAPEPVRWKQFCEVLQIEASASADDYLSPPLDTSVDLSCDLHKKTRLLDQVYWAERNGCLKIALKILETLPREEWQSVSI